MVDNRRAAGLANDRDDVEAQVVGAGRAVLHQPGTCQVTNPADLGLAHRLGWHPEADATARFDLHEDERGPLSCHDVELTSPAAPVSGQDLEPGRLEMLDSQVLAVSPERGRPSRRFVHPRPTTAPRPVVVRLHLDHLRP